MLGAPRASAWASGDVVCSISCGHVKCGVFAKQGYAPEKSVQMSTEISADQGNAAPFFTPPVFEDSVFCKRESTASYGSDHSTIDIDTGRPSDVESQRSFESVSTSDERIHVLAMHPSRVWKNTLACERPTSVPVEFCTGDSDCDLRILSEAGTTQQNSTRCMGGIRPLGYTKSLSWSGPRSDSVSIQMLCNIEDKLSVCLQQLAELEEKQFVNIGDCSDLVNVLFALAGDSLTLASSRTVPEAMDVHAEVNNAIERIGIVMESSGNRNS